MTKSLPECSGGDIASILNAKEKLMKLKLIIAFQLLFVLNGFAQSDLKTQQNSNAKPLDNEFLDLNVMRLNGKLPLITKTKSLFKLLGKPDSLIIPNSDDFCSPYLDKPVQLAYYKNSVFEVFGDTIVLTTINFKNNRKINVNTPLITLNYKTTLKDLENIFPTAVKDKYPLDHYELGKVTAVSLRTSKNYSDDSWILLFIDNKLISIQYWTPC